MVINKNNPKNSAVNLLICFHIINMFSFANHQLTKVTRELLKINRKTKNLKLPIIPGRAHTLIGSLITT